MATQLNMSSRGKPPKVGKCESCDGEFAINKDGTLRAHGPKTVFGLGCPGSWTFPTGVYTFGTIAKAG